MVEKAQEQATGGESPIQTETKKLAESFINEKDSAKKTEQAKKIAELLNSPESIKIIKETCGLAIKQAQEKIIEKQKTGKVLEGWEGSILDIHNILFGQETIEARLNRNIPNPKKIEDFKQKRMVEIKTVLQDIKDDPKNITENTKKLESLMNLDLNKADLKAIINEIKQEPIYSSNEILKSFVINSIDVATKKGFSIENSTDLVFLSESPKWKDIISKINPKLSFDNNTKYVAMGDSIKPLLSPGESKIPGMLMFAETEFDSFNLKDGVTPTADSLKKKVEGGKLDLSQFKGGIDQLLNSKNEILKGLGEFLKFFGQLFGFYKEDGQKAPEKTKGLPEREKIDRISKMLEKKSNQNDDFSVLGKESKLPDDKKSPQFLEYIQNVQDLVGVKEFSSTEKGTDQKPILEYGEDTQKQVAGLQDLLKEKRWLTTDQPKGVYTREMALAHKEYLNNGKVEKKPEEAPIVQPKIPEAKSEISAEKSAALKLLEGKKTQLTGTLESRKAIQTLAGVKTDGKFGPKTLTAIKELQGKLGVTADGKFGPKTLEALKAKPELLAEKEAPKSKI